MHICFITPEYVTEYYFSGGIAQTFHRIAKWLTLHNHEVDIIVASNINEDIIYEGTSVHRIAPRNSFLFAVLNKITFGRLSLTLGMLSFSYLAYKKIKTLSSQKIDIIQSVNYSFCGLFTLLFSSIPQVVRITSHRFLWTKFMFKKKKVDNIVIEFLESFYLHRIRYSFVPSLLLKEVFSKEASINHIRYIPTPFYIEETKLDNRIYKKEIEGKKYLLFFGRLEKKKGVHILAEALPEVFSKIPELHAVFIGRDMFLSERQTMKSYIIDQCKDFLGRLVIIGNLTHSQLYPCIKNAHLVVLPSLIDNFPNTLLESMGLGKAVLGTIGASFDEVIEDGVNGFLVPKDNVKALTEKIINIWGRSDLEQIGKNAAKKAQEYSPEKSVNQILEYYQDIIKKDSSKKLCH